jgi:hypothetical protein
MSEKTLSIFVDESGILNYVNGDTPFRIVGVNAYSGRFMLHFS